MAKRKQERWPELCEEVEADDGLPYREARAWTEDKLYRWNRYLEITTSAMAKKWSSLVYVDLFGGPGICQLKETKKRFPGSALIAARSLKPFSKILVCEKNAKLAAALKTRLDKWANDRASVFVGDCNAKIQEIADQIPPRSLTLAFIDPEALHVHFETLRILTQDRKVDLAILFPDGMDIVRNVERYEKQQESNLDRYLGPNSDWRARRQDVANQTPEKLRQLFSEIFQSQLDKLLGYKHFASEVYRNQQGPIYRIIFASKHPLGGTFWNEIAKKDRGGQTTFEF
jgi:three-Cys-motif partner protein